MQNRKRWSVRRWLGVGLLGLLAVVLVVVGYMAVVPPAPGNLASRPNPAASYDQAVQRVTALQAQEATGYNPVCKTQLLTHGQKTGRAIAFIHGYTNCPDQFVPLGQKFYDLGYNVLLVPMPHHGLADVMTNEQSRLTAEELAAYSDLVVDITRGLGDRASVAGISGGGVVAGWAAQTRPDLDQAALIAPALGLKLVPTPLTVLFANLALALPERYLWWDNPFRFDPTPPYVDPAHRVPGYPRFSTHGLAQQLRLGFATEALARHAAPAAKSILVVTNANDLAVDNSAAGRLAAGWLAHGGNVTRYEFPASLNLTHDLISPQQSLQRIDIVYPKLMELINGP